jgi:hypothetical protein
MGKCRAIPLAYFTIWHYPKITILYILTFEADFVPSGSQAIIKSTKTVLSVSP